MAFVSDKTMFEIYRESGCTRRFRVVYFTELGEHNKEAEISRAMAGEHFFDGFIKDGSVNEAKQVINGILERLNKGDAVATEEVERLLAPYAPAA